MTGLVLLIPLLVPSGSTEGRLAQIEARSGGKLGAAIITSKSQSYSRKNERFSLQSVMKLMVAMAAIDAVEQGKLKLDQRFTFRRSDLSISHQPLKDRLGNRSSIDVTVAECIELTVTQSCSAAGDFLVRKIGGIQTVNAFLRKNRVTGMSVDRQERDLQTEIVGLKWNLAYADDEAFEAAIRKVSPKRLDEAYRRYQADPRDTTTPAAMGDLLRKLIEGKLFSPKSTKYLMGVMERTQTGADRLRAGVPAGWVLGNKTGTSSSHRGVACATNDVGFARRASGEWVIIVALLRNSTLPPDGRANVIRQVATAAFDRGK